MRPYLVIATRREAPNEFGEWLNVVIEAIGLHPPNLPTPEISWHVRHSGGDFKGAGRFHGNGVRLIQADFEVRFPTVADEVVERWFLVQLISTPRNWKLELDEICGGDVLIKAGRNYSLVQKGLQTAFEDVGIYPKEINKIIRSHL